MRLLILFLVALAFLASASPTALAAERRPTGYPMMYKLPPEKAAEFTARYVQESLNKDPSGNSIIAGSPCTTPMDFYTAVKTEHPAADLSSVADLPGYLRRLVPGETPSGQFRMSWMRPAGGGKCTLELKGQARAFEPGEIPWIDPKLGAVVFAGGCANVVARRELPPLPEVEVAVAPIPHALEDSYFLRARAWWWESFTPALQARVLEILKNESDATSRGGGESVSKTMGPVFMKHWARGEIRTIDRPTSATVHYPGAEEGVRVAMSPGAPPDYPNEVYWETRVSRDLAREWDSRFGIVPLPPAGCKIVYPRQHPDGTGVLKALAPFDGRPSELAQDARTQSEGFNLNFIVSCPVLSAADDP